MFKITKDNTKVGDKLICINSSNIMPDGRVFPEFLTEGKVYTVLSDTRNFLSILDDNNVPYYLYGSTRFKLLSDIRDNKLTNLLK